MRFKVINERIYYFIRFFSSFFPLFFLLFSLNFFRVNLNGKILKCRFQNNTRWIYIFYFQTFAYMFFTVRPFFNRVDIFFGRVLYNGCPWRTAVIIRDIIKNSQHPSSHRSRGENILLWLLLLFLIKQHSLNILLNLPPTNEQSRGFFPFFVIFFQSFMMFSNIDYLKLANCN